MRPVQPDAFWLLICRTFRLSPAGITTPFPSPFSL
jgi:hypothetical protein